MATVDQLSWFKWKTSTEVISHVMQIIVFGFEMKHVSSFVFLFYLIINSIVYSEIYRRKCCSVYN